MNVIIVKQRRGTPLPFPAIGDAVLITAGAGIFLGHDGEVAVFDTSGWVFLKTEINREVYVLDDETWYVQTQRAAPWIWTKGTAAFANVGTITIKPGSYADFYLGVRVWDGMYNVTQRRNSVSSVSFESVATAGTTTTLLVDATRHFYMEAGHLIDYYHVGAQPAGQIRVGGNIRKQMPVGTIVHNVRTGNWGIITAFVDAYTATISGFAVGSIANDVIEFYSAVVGGWIRNLTHGVTRSISAYSLATPDRVALSAAIPVQGPGDSYRYYPPTNLWLWDTKGFSVCKPSPIPGSNPPSMRSLNIHNASDMAMEFIVSWE